MDLVIIGLCVLAAVSLPLLWLRRERKNLRARYAEIDSEEG